MSKDIPSQYSRIQIVYTDDAFNRIYIDSDVAHFFDENVLNGESVKDNDVTYWNLELEISETNCKVLNKISNVKGVDVRIPCYTHQEDLLADYGLQTEKVLSIIGDVDQYLLVLNATKYKNVPDLLLKDKLSGEDFSKLWEYYDDINHTLGSHPDFNPERIFKEMINDGLSDIRIKSIAFPYDDEEIITKTLKDPKFKAIRAAKSNKQMYVDKSVKVK